MDIVRVTGLRSKHGKGVRAIWQAQFGAHADGTGLVDKDGPYKCYAVVEDDEVVSACVVSSYSFETAARLYAVATHPRHERKGYAKALLQHVIADGGYERVSLESYPEAVGFYEKIGFDRHEEEGQRICPIMVWTRDTHTEAR